MPALQKQIEYTIGCDPELFVTDSEGSFVSAHDLLPGNKFFPCQVKSGAVQVDGTAAEFNIAPAHGSGEFTRNITSVMKQMHQMLIISKPGFQLRAVPVAQFKPDYFESLPAEALMFGCSPDYQAWNNGDVQEFSGTNKPIRTGGGHIHIGWTEEENAFDQAHLFDCIQATKQMDASLYMSSLLWDNNDARREVYGKMGSFRPKPYGVEYRPLSNVWVGDRALHIFIFRCVSWAMKLLDTDGVELWDTDAVADHIALIRSGGKLNKNDLIDLHHEMHTKFGMPLLPSRYLTKDKVYTGSDLDVTPAQAARAILGA